MLTHDPGESTALEDALFKAVKMTGWAGAICSAAPARETILRSFPVLFILSPPCATHYVRSRLKIRDDFGVSRAEWHSQGASARSGFPSEDQSDGPWAMRRLPVIVMGELMLTQSSPFISQARPVPDPVRLLSSTT